MGADPSTDVLEDLSLSDGAAYNERLMPISRGDTLPDRSIPVEYITYDLWESMRAHDLKMANDILEPVFTFMRAQTDPVRLKTMGLREYLEYRERDVGKGYVYFVYILSSLHFPRGPHIIIPVTDLFQSSRRSDALLHASLSQARGPSRRAARGYEL